MDYVYGTLLLAVMFLGIIGLVGTYVAGKSQTRKKDEETSERVVKHKVMLNPIYISYILFPVLTVIGAVLFYFYYYQGR